jgi:hypothetical protein
MRRWRGGGTTGGNKRRRPRFALPSSSTSMSTSGAVPPGYLLGVGDRRDVAHAAKNDGMTTPALPTATSAITGVRYRTATPTRRALEDMRRRRAEASERLRAMALLATLLAIALGLRLAGGAHGGGGGGGTRLNGGGGGGGATTTIIMGGGLMKGAAATQWTRRTRAISSSRLTSSSGAPMPTPSLARMRPHLFREIDFLTNYRRFRLPSS